MPQISSGDYTPGALSHGGQAILTALLACDAELVRHEVELHEFVATVKALDDELAEALEASCS